MSENRPPSSRPHPDATLLPEAPNSTPSSKPRSNPPVASSRRPSSRPPGITDPPSLLPADWSPPPSRSRSDPPKDNEAISPETMDERTAKMTAVDLHKLRARAEERTEIRKAIVPDEARRPDAPADKTSNVTAISEEEKAETLWLDRLLIGTCVFTLGFMLLQLLLMQYGRDQGIYAVVADTMLKGKAPYRDAWDFKPPGIFFIYAMARGFSTSMMSIRIFEVIGFASIVGAFSILSKRFMGDWRPGVVGGTIAAITQAQLEFWHTAQPESFGAVVLSWALVCATYEADKTDEKATLKQTLAWAGAGALFTCSSLLKPPLGGGILVSGALIWYRLWTDDNTLSVQQKARRLIRPTLAIAAGAVLPLITTGLYFVSKHAWGDLYETLFIFTPNYTKLGFRSEWLMGLIYLAFEQFTFTYSAVLAVGLMFYLGLPKLNRSETLGAAHVAGVITFNLIGIALQAKFFPYHYGAVLPFGAFLAGVGFWKLWLKARKSTWAILGLTMLVYALMDARTATKDVANDFSMRCRMRMDALLKSSTKWTDTNDILHSVADVNAGANREVAEWLRGHTPQDSSLFIWGFEPVIHVMSGRPPASRYNYNVAQRVAWENQTHRITLMKELKASKPYSVVVEHRDVFPAVTGNNLDSAWSLRDFTELADFVEGDYELATTIEDFDVYLRKQ